MVSIAGPYRKGKSYILSKAFDQGGVFPLGVSLDPETMGIWMWIVPDKLKVFKSNIFGDEKYPNSLNTERSYKRSAVCTLLASFAPIMAAFCNGHYRYKSSAKSLVVCFQEMIH